MASDHRKIISTVFTRATLCAAFVLVASACEAVAAEYTLERVVLVSRHGVRAPTDSKALENFTVSRKWPDWPVKDGWLTPRGKMLVSRMGAYYRRDFAARGLLPADRPPAENQVYVWADVDQRTRETGAGLIEGIFACGDSCPSAGSDYGDIDPLFHPVKAGVCKIDPARAQEEIKKAAGGSLDSALDRLRGTVQRLQKVLDCCQPKLCQAQGLRCTLETLKSSIKDGGTGLSGPIAIGSTASEVFLLEYAQGLPGNKVAWGLVSTPADINELLKLHGLQFDLIDRTKYLAQRQASALVQQVLETLRQTAEGKSDPMRPVPPHAKLVIYVGHDTNLANIGGTLAVDWQLRTYLLNETPPAGAMAFELLREKTSGQFFVRMAYYSQTLDQMRNAKQLTLPRLSGPPTDSVPDYAKIMPACGHPQDGACPWGEFADWMQHSVEPACVKPQ